MRILRECLILICLLIAAAYVLGDRTPRAFYGEMSAIRTIVTLHTAEAQYYSQSGRFAGSLGELVAADLIPVKFPQTGYNVTLSLTPRGYAIHADPTHFGTTGTRPFYSDPTLAIHQHHGPASATASDPLLK